MEHFIHLQDLLYNQAGELVVPEGQNADDGMLAGMGFYVQGIDDELPQ